MKYPYLRTDEIDAAAGRLLQVAFGAADGIPYPLDLEALVFEYLCEREDLVFDDEQDLGEQDGDPILGMMRPFRNAILISAPLKRDGPEGRYRFTVAHEIGHWVLHRPLFLAAAEQSELFRGNAGEADDLVSLNRNVFPEGGGRERLPPEEWQANRFAVALLLDDRILRAAFVERFGEPPLPRRREDGFVRSTSLRKLSRLVASEQVRGRPPLQDLFGLSTEAMAIALESRGYVVEGPLLM